MFSPSPHQKGKEFRKFLQQRKLSFSTFLFILFGSWLTCLGLTIYIGILDFSSWSGAGRYLLLWLVWLALSFWLGGKPHYRKIIWYSNHLFFVSLFFLLIFQSPVNWFLILFEYILLLLLSLVWAGACFFSVWELLLPAFLGTIGLFSFFATHLSLFLETSSALLFFFLSLIFITVVTATTLWNTFRSKELLGSIYREKQNLEEVAKVLRIRIQAKTKELRQQAENLKKESNIRAQALRARVQELEKFRQVAVGRELKMIELKKEISQLSEEFKKLKKGNGKRKRK